MKDEQRPGTTDDTRGRRRFLGLTGLLGAAWLLPRIGRGSQPGLPSGPRPPSQLSLKEADYYRAGYPIDRD